MDEGMSLFYMSFCDGDMPKGSKFLGAVMVFAEDLQSAVLQAWVMGVNPGGEVASMKASSAVASMVDKKWLNRLLSKDEVDQFDLEMSLKVNQMNETNESGAALATIESIALPVAFLTQQVTDSIAKIRVAALAEAEGLDVSRPKDREAMRSIAHRVAKSKVAMEKLGKSLSDRRKAEIADEVNAIMAERKRIEAELDELRDQIKAPAEEFDAREKARIDAHESAIKEIEEIGRYNRPVASSDDVRALIAELDALPDRDWQEFADRATRLVSITREDLQHRLAVQVKAETDAAELARLQHEEAARQQRERDATIARIAAEQARQAAEDAAKLGAQIEAARVENERLAAEEKARAEREAIEAAAQSDRDAAAERERLANEALAQAERDRQQAELGRIAVEDQRRVDAERAEADRIAAAAKAERDQAAAIEAERQRVAKIAADEAAERKRREADREHRGRVNAAARDAVMDAIGEFTSTSAGEANKIAEAIVKAIATGRVPGVTISY
jgi:hypothetical protein